MLQVYHDPASTVPPQMADRIEALRAALEEIFFSQETDPFIIRHRAKDALHADDAMAYAQDEGQLSVAQQAIEDAADASTAYALESLQFMPDPEPPFDGCSPFCHVTSQEGSIYHADGCPNSDMRERCGYCGEPCILDPHFACAMEQAQR